MINLIQRDETSSNSSDIPDSVPGTSHEDQQAIAGLLVILTIFTSYCLSYFAWKKKWLWLQDSMIALIMGIIVGACVTYGSGGIMEAEIMLNPNFFYDVILPPIIFEAGYSINRPRFRKNFPAIMLLAVGGVVSSAFVSAGIMFGLTYSQIQVDFNFLELLCYASTLTATDPVSVLSVFQTVPVHPDVDIIIFGESALNDAVAIVIYSVTSAFAKPGVEITPTSIGIAIGDVVLIFVVAVLLGIAFGLISTLTLRYINLRDRGSSLEMAIVFLCAYASYLLSELLAFSGIITILFCGIFMSKYTIPNLTELAHESTERTLRVISSIFETALFCYLGFALGGMTNNDRTFDAAFFFITLFALLVSRLLSVVLFVPLSNLTRRKSSRLDWKKAGFIWYAGLRGGIAFVLALDMRASPDFRLSFRQLCLGTTLLIVLVSVIVFGGACAWVLKWFGVDYKPNQLFVKESEFQIGKFDELHRYDRAWPLQTAEPGENDENVLETREKDVEKDVENDEDQDVENDEDQDVEDDVYQDVEKNVELIEALPFQQARPMIENSLENGPVGYSPSQLPKIVIEQATFSEIPESIIPLSDFPSKSMGTADGLNSPEGSIMMKPLPSPAKSMAMSIRSGTIPEAYEIVSHNQPTTQVQIRHRRNKFLLKLDDFNARYVYPILIRPESLKNRNVQERQMFRGGDDTILKEEAAKRQEEMGKKLPNPI